MIIKKENFYGLLVFFAALLLYLKTLAPGILLWDAAEWVTIAHNLGISHPPGAPVYILIAHLFSKLPLATDVAWRVNMLSALTASATIYLVFRILIILLQKFSTSIAFSAALFAAASLAVSHTFWLNAVAAEVYAPASFLATLIIYLMLRCQKKPNDQRYYLLIFYLFGLSIGVHLIVLLIFPAVLWFIFVKKGIGSWKSALLAVAGFILVYPGLLKWLPQWAAERGGWIYFLLPVLLIGIYSLAVKFKKLELKFMSIAALVFLLGLSCFFMVFVLSDVQPNHQGKIQTLANFADYLNRSQYGEWQQLPRRFQSIAMMPDSRFDAVVEQWRFFWHYQLNHMYLRYFSWNFISPPHAVSLFSGLLLFLGFIGVWQLCRLDKNTAIALIIMFLSTGVALVWYLNQTNPQPRERDYIYVISFLVYFMFTGIGFAAFLHFLQSFVLPFKKLTWLVALTATTFFLIGPALTGWLNFKSHDFSDNTFAKDYAENVLDTCEPHAILFTGGDNDTYPLWYAQYVCGHRTDVRVINLSMLNESGYIEQLGFKPEQILQSKNHAGLRLQDRAVAWMMAENAHLPIYFTVGVGQDDLLGLENNLRLDGLVYKFVLENTNTSRSVFAELLDENLSKYKYNVCRLFWQSDNGYKSLVQQYQVAHMLLIENYIDAGHISDAVETLVNFENRLPFDELQFPKQRLNLLIFYSQLYGHAGMQDEQLRLARLAVHYLPDNQNAQRNLIFAMKNEF